MANKTYDQCRRSILKDIEKRKTVVYEDKNSVRRYNAAMNRIVENSKTINELFPESKEDFFLLIYSEDGSIARTIASLVINHLDYPIEQKREAIDVLKRLLSEKKVDRLSEITLSYAIARWEAMYPM